MTTDPVTGNPGSVQMGNGTVTGGGVDSGTIIASGGTLEYIGSLTGAGQLQINSKSTLRLDSGRASSLAILFNSGSAETLILDTPGTALANSLTGLAVGDRIKLGAGLTITAAVSLGPDILQLQVTPPGQASTTYDLTDTALPIGTSFTIGTDAITGDSYVELACYVEGTHITTPTDPRPIETLHLGDRLLLADGGSRPVVSLGYRRVDCRRHPRLRDVWPVCVRPSAFGPGLPHRELLLSPDHAVFDAGV